MQINLSNSSQTLESSENKFPVVGVGASAGGLTAFKEFVKGIPEQSGMAYVMVQHLDPKHDSQLSEILQRSTLVPVLEITDEIEVKPDHIYIIPSNKMLLASDGVLKLSKRPAPEKNKKNLPIDLFFKSLAIIHESHSLGVVLSGKAADGTQGLKDIKNMGGITFAQDEDSAEWPQMPQSAILAGVVDFILPPSEIPKKILELMKDLNSHPKGSEVPGNDAETFQQILSLMRKRRNNDFTYYKESTISRRIFRRMAINKHQTPESYLQFLRKNSAEVDVLFQDMLIPVTSFFRDSGIFENLCSSLLPQIIKNKTDNEPIRVWIAGCSTGEEAYSMAICMHEYLVKNSSRDPEKRGKDPLFNGHLQIFASDISEPAIQYARKGIYKEGEVENISPERLENYFVRTKEGYQIKKEVRESCVFAVHNFLVDPPFGNMDLISCRNVLIYFQPYLQKKALTTFHYSLKPGAHLLLGKSESVGSAPGYFTPTNKKDKLFKRNNIPRSFGTPAGSNNHTHYFSSQTEMVTPVEETDFQRTADRLLLKTYTPASIVVNEAMEIVHYRGSTSRYLEQQNGVPSHNLMKMAKPGLAFELRNIIHKVKKDGKPVRKSLKYISQQGDRQSITVEAMRLPKIVDPHYLLIFQPSIPAVKEPKNEGVHNNMDDDRDLRIRELENELTQSREDMREISDEQEAVNEELQSANEEFLSGSEELQSLNEELETSKEELQSTNEELTVINQELGAINLQLTEERDFANAVINTTRKPMIVLDGRLRVVTANKAFSEIFGGRPDTTQGKKFYELDDDQWNIPKLRKLLESILPENEKVDDFELAHTFSTFGKRYLILNARTIRRENSDKNRILLSIEDITQRRTIEKKLEETMHRFKEMIYSSPSPIAILQGPEFILSIANDAFFNHLGAGEHMLGTPFLEAVPELEEQGLGDTLRKVYRTGEPRYVHELPVRLLRNGKPELSYYNFVYQVQRDPEGVIEGVAMMANEVTVEAALNKTIKESEFRFHQMADLTPDKIICADSSGKIYYFNKSWLDYTGMKLKTLLKKGWSPFLHPEEAEAVRIKWEEARSSGEVFEKELRLRDKNEDYKWHLCRMVPLKDDEGKVSMWIGAITQIQKIKEEEERKEGFFKMVSHELKTPLTSIKGYTYLLLERLRQTPESLPESIPIIPSLERIDGQVSRLTRLISEMVDLSRIQECKLELQKESFSLNEMVEESVQDIQYSSTTARVKIHHEEQLQVDGDRDRISQVLINLITNAIKYSPGEGLIEVRVFREQKGMGSVSVMDQGIGIDPEDQRNIFERFFRAAGKDEKTYAGFGIGLFLAKEIMTRHSGDIKVSSQKGKGSEFTFSLPLTPEHM